MKKVIFLLLFSILLCSCSAKQTDTTAKSTERTKVDNSAVPDTDEILKQTNEILRDMGIEEIETLPQITYEIKEDSETAEFCIEYGVAKMMFPFVRYDWLDNKWLCSLVNEADDQAKFYWVQGESKTMYDIYNPQDGTLLSKATEKSPSIDELMDDYNNDLDAITDETNQKLQDLYDSYDQN